MKNIILALQLVLIIALNLQCKKPPTYTCEGYDFFTPEELGE